MDSVQWTAVAEGASPPSLYVRGSRCQAADFSANTLQFIETLKLCDGS